MSRLDGKEDKFLRDLFRETGHKQASEDFTGKVMERVRLETVKKEEPWIASEWVLFFVAAASLAALWVFGSLIPGFEGVLKTFAGSAGILEEGFSRLFSYAGFNGYFIFVAAAVLLPLLLDYFLRQLQKKDVKVRIP